MDWGPVSGEAIGGTDAASTNGSLEILTALESIELGKGTSNAAGVE